MYNGVDRLTSILPCVPLLQSNPSGSSDPPHHPLAQDNDQAKHSSNLPWLYAVAMIVINSSSVYRLTMLISIIFIPNFRPAKSNHLILALE